MSLRSDRWMAGLLVGAVLCLCGCTETRLTDPPHTATELYLLSTAVEHAIKPLDAEKLRGRTVYIDESYLTQSNHKYLAASARAKLLQEGAAVTDERSEAEVIVELRTPGVSIDRTEFTLGIPALPLGTVAAAAGAPPTALTTPELALLKNRKQDATAGVAYVAYWADTGEIIDASGPHIGRSYREDWWFFGVRNTVSDIPPAEPAERGTDLRLEQRDAREDEGEPAEPDASARDPNQPRDNQTRDQGGR